MLRDLFSLFPAYAGVIPIKAESEELKATFPRICGGDPDSSIQLGKQNGFSPHMRG